MKTLMMSIKVQRKERSCSGQEMMNAGLRVLPGAAKVKVDRQQGRKGTGQAAAQCGDRSPMIPWDKEATRLNKIHRGRFAFRMLLSRGRAMCS